MPSWHGSRATFPPTRPRRRLRLTSARHARKSNRSVLRAVVDTNVWVSGFLNPHGAPARLRLAYRQGKFIAVTSEPLLAELAEVLTRPKLTSKYQTRW